ncbi:MAG: adenosylhomocysteine nucleosidase [Chthoniobacter sp.]|jgi:adenosylhomocysteine nucleosidase|nr:adenosylhomocysteine nucleosidase [Chthoniobacter sp.]
MIAITFALPQESQDFRRALQPNPLAGALPMEFLRGKLGAQEVIVAHTGVGLDAARRKAEALLGAVRPRMLVAAGFAGGLDPRLAVGDLAVATNFSAPALLERARAIGAGAAGFFEGPLVTSPRPIESAADKAQLALASGALAVDMETSALAAACLSAGIPLLAVRAISDAVGDPLPVPFAEWFDLRQQRPRPVALLRYLVAHPRRILPFVHFVHGLTPARHALTQFLIRFVEDFGRTAPSFSAGEIGGHG